MQDLSEYQHLFDGYLRDGAAIYAESFRRIDQLIDVDHLAPPMQKIATRIVHATGDPAMIDGLCELGDVATAVRAAIQKEAPVLVDAHMVASGITKLPNNIEIICKIKDDSVAARAVRENITRSMAVVEDWQGYLAGAIVVIGNAPTALFRLLEGILFEGWDKPSAILAFPIGFVGAAESKDAYAKTYHAHQIPGITMTGRFGGSAMAAAAMNAILLENA